MSKRNFTLLIIVLVIVVAVLFGFLFYKNAPVAPGEEPGGTNFFSQFNPFSNNDSTTPDVTPPPTDISDYVPPEEETNLSLLKVSSMPVAGYTVFQKERFKEVPVVAPSAMEGEGALPAPVPTKPTPPQTEFVPALRYVDRATGNIYQTFADKIEERKFSVTVIPKVYEAVFGNGGEAVVMRYVKGDGKSIETFFGKLPKEILGGDSTGENEVRGTFLPANITDLSLTADGKNLFYLFDSGETTIGTTLDLTTEKKAQIFDSAFNEWLPLWPNSKLITLTTKPSYLAPGYMYKLDTGTKGFSQILADITGLTTLTSPDGKKVLYANNTLALNIYHTDTKVSESLGVRTLPEKCVWGKDSLVIYCAAPKMVTGANYPDIWYQGETSFDDQIWKIEVETGSASILLDPASTTAGENVDGIKLSLDQGEKYLFFVNKKDSFLWKFDLE
ncbi:MAG: hypothetical protein WCT29_02835 [Candidatus Paceibacterota bacterium]|jgi:hypothetical protein